MNGKRVALLMVDSNIVLRPGRIMKLLAIMIVLIMTLDQIFDQPPQFVIGELVGAIAMAVGLAGDAWRRSKGL